MADRRATSDVLRAVKNPQVHRQPLHQSMRGFHITLVASSRFEFAGVQCPLWAPQCLPQRFSFPLHAWHRPSESGGTSPAPCPRQACPAKRSKVPTTNYTEPVSSTHRGESDSHAKGGHDQREGKGRHGTFLKPASHNSHTASPNNRA